MNTAKEKLLKKAEELKSKIQIFIVNGGNAPRYQSIIQKFEAELASINRQLELLEETKPTGKVEDDDWSKLAYASGILSEAQIFIDDTPGISINEIRTKCRKMKLEKNIGLVVIDYLQLVHLMMPFIMMDN